MDSIVAGDNYIISGYSSHESGYLKRVPYFTSIHKSNLTVKASFTFASSNYNVFDIYANNIIKSEGNFAGFGGTRYYGIYFFSHFSEEGELFWLKKIDIAKTNLQLQTTNIHTNFVKVDNGFVVSTILIHDVDGILRAREVVFRIDTTTMQVSWSKHYNSDSYEDLINAKSLINGCSGLAVLGNGNVVYAFTNMEKDNPSTSLFELSSTNGSIVWRKDINVQSICDIKESRDGGFYFAGLKEKNVAMMRKIEKNTGCEGIFSETTLHLHNSGDIYTISDYSTTTSFLNSNLLQSENEDPFTQTDIEMSDICSNKQENKASRKFDTFSLILSFFMFIIVHFIQ